MSKFQQISLGFLFPYLKPGGLYFIEDLDWQPPFENPHDLKTLELARRFQEAGTIQSQFMMPAERDYLQSHIQSCAVHGDKLCVLTKRGDLN